MASRILDFFPACLRHVKGPLGGQPLHLEPWQEAILGNLFGWLRPDGTRRYREAFILVPRKNGKTALASGIVLYTLFCDGEEGAEIYSAAADREQASLIFAQAKGMVVQEPALRKRCQIYATARSIVREESQSSYRVLSGVAESKHGLNAHCVIIDELHTQPNRELVDVLITSTGARLQPLVLYTTTSDFERPSICNEKYEYACRVRDGIISDASFLPVIYEAKLTDPFDSPAIWAKANPNLGISITTDYLARECQRAKETPSYLNTFLRLHLNIKTQQDIAWLDLSRYDACQTGIAAEDFYGQLCYGGLDLASTSDLCALTLYFPQQHTVLAWFWLPEQTAPLRERKSRVPYPSWVHEGFIKATEGNVTDYDVIRTDLNELATRYHIKELAIDRWNSTQLQTQLLGDGFDVVPFGQGYASMSAPSKELERMIQAGELRHDGNPVLRWMMSNVMIEQDAAGNIKPSKRKSTEKIDGVVSLCMALGRAMVAPAAPTSVYEERGLLTL